MLDIVVTGLSANSVPYSEGLSLQRAVHQAVVSGQRPDTVILLEHEPVYTAGKRTSPDERPTDGTPVVDVDRGGKITWHGPGQLVGYPIVRLPEPIDVVDYVRRLEGALIAVLAEFGIEGRRVDGPRCRTRPAPRSGLPRAAGRSRPRRWAREGGRSDSRRAGRDRAT